MVATIAAMVSMEISLGRSTLRNPIVLASGTCGAMGEVGEVIDLNRIGAITTKSVTVAPREGNPPLRMADLPIGMLNAIGLANDGIEHFVEHHAPRAPGLACSVIGSAAGDSIDDYVAVAAALDACESIDAVELNVSCPNTDDGLEFGHDATRLGTLLSAVRPALASSAMIVKLSAAVGDLRPHAACAIEHGADALTLINTIPALSIDPQSRAAVISRGIGGLSGPAIHPIAVRVVREVWQDVAADADVPIIGTGGVMAWEDAAEFILAGATAIGLGTVLFVDPRMAITIASGLERWVAGQGCASVSELVGAADC